MVDLGVQMSNKGTQVGRFIKSTWTNVNIRCGKYKHLQTKSKCKTYINIQIEFTRQEYKEWCMERQEIILKLDRPSLDRIDKNKNYRLDNIQIIELSENIVKDKTVFTGTEGVCRRCKQRKPISEFIVCKRISIGYASTCKVCETIRCRIKDKGRKRVREDK